MAMKFAVGMDECSHLRSEYANLYRINWNTGSTNMIQLISRFDIASQQTNGNESVIICAFLEEKVDYSVNANQLFTHVIETSQFQAQNKLLVWNECYQSIKRELNQFHKNGFIHGGIRSSNILFGRKISIKIHRNQAKNQTLLFNATLEQPACYLAGLGGVLQKADILHQDYALRQPAEYSHPILYQQLTYSEGREQLSTTLRNENGVLNGHFFVKDNVTFDNYVNSMMFDIFSKSEQYSVAVVFATFFATNPSIVLAGRNDSHTDSFFKQYHMVLRKKMVALSKMAKARPGWHSPEQAQIVSNTTILQQYHYNALIQTIDIVECRLNSFAPDVDCHALLQDLNMMKREIGWLLKK